jgi:hypothetical protein
MSNDNAIAAIIAANTPITDQYDRVLDRDQRCSGWPGAWCGRKAAYTFDLCEQCTREVDTLPQKIASLRDQLATAHEALGEARAILQERDMDGWEARLLGIITKALKGA